MTVAAPLFHPAHCERRISLPDVLQKVSFESPGGPVRFPNRPSDPLSFERLYYSVLRRYTYYFPSEVIYEQGREVLCSRLASQEFRYVGTRTRGSRGTFMELMLGDLDRTRPYSAIAFPIVSGWPACLSPYFLRLA